MLAAKTEKDALFGTLTFQVMHYALRPWPWIIVALASTIVYPSLHDIQVRFPYLSPQLLGDDIAYPAMLVYLPAGFAGFMVAGIFAAYRSTIETHLNWGTSYLVHDFYRRFITKDATEKHYVLTGRVVTVLLMFVGVAFTFALDNAKQGFDLLLSIGAGTGLIYLLRWFWWRINAWSEVAAMAASFIVSLSFFVAQKMGHDAGSTTILLCTVGVTTVVWLTATYVTRPDDEATLAAFYAKVRPAGPGWKRVRQAAGLPPSPDSPARSLLGWFLGVTGVYAALFATGSYLYGDVIPGIVWTTVTLVAAGGLVVVGSRLWSASET